MGKEDKVTKETIMSDKVMTALLSGKMKLPDGKKLRCDIALREFNFKRGIYDVVGYNKQENAVYVIECKLGTNITSIGQAFGQILAYRSILTERGYEFLNRFFEKYYEDVMKTKDYLKLKLDDWKKIIDIKTMNFRFFIALKEQAQQFVREITEIKNNIGFKIGILMVTKSGICTPRFGTSEEIDRRLIENESILIPLVKKYAKTKFLQEIKEKLKILLPEKYSTKFESAKARDGFIQFNLFPYTHYEIWITKEHVEIGLHIEPSKDKKDKAEKIFSFLSSREHQIKSSLGRHVKIEKWGKYWARVYERVGKKDLDENFLNEVSSRLKEYIENLQPLLEQMEDYKV